MLQTSQHHVEHLRGQLAGQVFFLEVVRPCARYKAGLGNKRPRPHVVRALRRQQCPPIVLRRNQLCLVSNQAANQQCGALATPKIYPNKQLRTPPCYPVIGPATPSVATGPQTTHQHHPLTQDCRAPALQGSNAGLDELVPVFQHLVRDPLVQLQIFTSRC